MKAGRWWAIALASRPGCWLILEAQGEVLREAIQNLEGLCAYWGWELEDPDLIT